MSNIDALKNVPEISFIDDNPETLTNTLILGYQAAFKKATGEEKILYATEKERIWLNTVALKFYQMSMMMDLSAKQNFLKYAKGAYLANIGATRSSLTPADKKNSKVPIQITLSQALPTNKTIPVGTRVTAGDNVFFETLVDCIIPAGQTFGIFVFQCTEAGIIGNEYAIGSINTLVDPVPFVKSIENIEISQGGADVQSDDSFTQEVWEAPEGYAVAGPEAAYIYRTKSFSQVIEDVVAYSPDDKYSFSYIFKNDSNVDTTEAHIINNDNTIVNAGTNISSYVFNLSTGEIELHFTKPISSFKGLFPRGGIVNIVPLLKNAEIPTQTFLNELKEFLSADKFRPLTDKVETMAPTIKDYDIDIKYWIDEKDKDIAIQIQAAVNIAINDYKIWQDSKLKRDINPDELIHRAKAAGAKRLEVTEPIYTKVEKTEKAKCGTLSINYAGLED